MVANGLEHGPGVGFEEVDDEVVRVLRRDGVWSKTTGGKVPQVAGHDHIGFARDRCGQHMAVVGIRQVKPRSKRPVVGHDGIGKVFVHDRAGPVQDAWVDVGPVGQKAAHPFRMNVRAPKRRIEIPVGEAQQKVAKAG